MTFTLDTGHEYIQLNQLLKLLNLVESGGEANQVITAGEVMVNNQPETQKRKKLKPGDVVLFNDEIVEIKEAV